MLHFISPLITLLLSITALSCYTSLSTVILSFLFFLVGKNKNAGWNQSLSQRIGSKSPKTKRNTLKCPCS